MLDEQRPKLRRAGVQEAPLGPDTLIAAQGRPLWSKTAAAMQPTPSSCSSSSIA